MGGRGRIGAPATASASHLPPPSPARALRVLPPRDVPQAGLRPARQQCVGVWGGRRGRGDFVQLVNSVWWKDGRQARRTGPLSSPLPPSPPPPVNEQIIMMGTSVRGRGQRGNGRALLQHGGTSSAPLLPSARRAPQCSEPDQADDGAREGQIRCRRGRRHDRGVRRGERSMA